MEIENVDSHVLDTQILRIMELETRRETNKCNQLHQLPCFIL